MFSETSMFVAMRINKHGLSILAVICLSLPLCAQPAATAARHTLWKVQGQQNSVYLLGSVHVLKASDYPLAAPIEAAFSNASVVAFETDIAALDDPAIAMKLMSKSQLPEGETLSKQLSPEVYKMWTRHVTESGLPPEMFERFTPAMASLTIAMLEMQKLGLDPNQGVDKHFFALARKLGKEIVPLEPVEFQINLLTGFSKEEGEALMKSTLKDMDNLKKDLAELLKAWKTGNAAQLEKLLNEAMKESPAIYKRMLTDRNQNWIPKIEELARGKKNAVVIVGAAHLVGKDGVVELLRKKGATVTQE
jgi:uncharacterized protein YbaP (TraB family)